MGHQWQTRTYTVLIETVIVSCSEFGNEFDYSFFNKIIVKYKDQYVVGLGVQMQILQNFLITQSTILLFFFNTKSIISPYMILIAYRIFLLNLLVQLQNLKKHKVFKNFNKDSFNNHPQAHKIHKCTYFFTLCITE